MRAGDGPDEKMQRAGDLGSSFVGVPFGYNFTDSDRTIYGRIGAIETRHGRVLLHLDGVAPDSEVSVLELEANEPVYTTSSDTLSQILITLNDLSK